MIAVESLTDDARTTTLLPGVGEERVPPRAGDAGAGGAVGDVGTPVPRELLMWTPSAQDLLGLTTTWSRTRLKLIRHREVRGHLEHRYPILPRRARDYHDGKLMGITLLGRMISSMTMRICRPCGLAL
jgi:hypothetical protein